ncbi:tetratricopeptide repeat protein [Magnetovibrio sp. PR-2]|uniref:tetratricopeptide repeat protein n=1 Tax=Magnetovibrio sp. PR-2 TaxID=3120356 RepID=UPI002FCE325B
MKRLLFATVALMILAGVTYVTLGSKPEMSPEVLKKMKLVSRFKDILPKAEAGSAADQYKIAIMYETGDGTKKDPREAVKWLMKAAEQGYPDARVKLGISYANGEMVRQDYFLAAKYYRLAATFNNNPEAQFRLGELHFNGRGVDHDYNKATKYYEQAAAQGHGAAQYILSSMYEEGWGLKRDLIKAYIWMKLAVNRRDQVIAVNKKYDPAKKIKILVKKMNRFQIETAEKQLKKMAASAK